MNWTREIFPEKVETRLSKILDNHSDNCSWLYEITEDLILIITNKESDQMFNDIVVDLESEDDIN